MSGETGRTTAKAQAGTCVVWGRCVCVCALCVHCVWRGEEV